MSQLSDKILSYSPEMYRTLTEPVTPTTTSSSNLGSVTLTYGLAGVAGQTTYNSDGPLGGGAGSWNLNQLYPTQFSNGITVNSSPTSVISALYSDRDTYQGMWFKFATSPSIASAVRLMTSNASTAATNSGFSIGLISRSAGGFRINMTLSNGTSFFSTSGVSNVTDGNWHYLAVRRYGNTFDVYVDGVLEITGTSSVVSTTYSVNFGNGSGYNQSAYVMRMAHLHIGSTTNFTASAPMDIWLAGSTNARTVKYFDGTTWQTSSAQKVWSGTAWVDWNAKRYDGSAWVNV